MALSSVIATSNKVPGSYIQVSLGVGPRSAGDAPRKILLYGNKTSAGSQAVEEPVQVLTEDDAKTLFGPGSELHRMVRAALKVSQSVDLNAVAITEAGTAASAAPTFAAGPASADGTVECWIGDTKVTAAISSGDAIADVATALSTAINDEVDLPVTASPAAGVCTVTAKNLGVRGNHIRIRTKLTGATGITHTALNQYLTSGATLDDPQNAIDAAGPQRWYYHVAPYDTATELTKFKTRVDSDAEPETGQRELYVFASQSSLATVTTLATGQNAARGQCVWNLNSPSTPAEMAAAMAALRAETEGSNPAANYDNVKLTGVAIAYTETDWPENSELISALNNGITPLFVSAGEAYITRAITAKSQDASGKPDYGVLDVHKVVVPDFIADELDANWNALAAGKRAAPDDPDGDPPDNPLILTPSIVRDFIYDILKSHDTIGGDGIINSVDENATQLVVELADSPDGRFNASIPTDVVELAHQFAADLRQAG